MAFSSPSLSPYHFYWAYAGCPLGSRQPVARPESGPFFRNLGESLFRRQKKLLTVTKKTERRLSLQRQADPKAALWTSCLVDPLLSPRVKKKITMIGRGGVLGLEKMTAGWMAGESWTESGATPPPRAWRVGADLLGMKGSGLETVRLDAFRST